MSTSDPTEIVSKQSTLLTRCGVLDFFLAVWAISSALEYLKPQQLRTATPLQLVASGTKVARRFLAFCYEIESVFLLGVRSPVSFRGLYSAMGPMGFMSTVCSMNSSVSTPLSSYLTSNYWSCTFSTVTRSCPLNTRRVLTSVAVSRFVQYYMQISGFIKIFNCILCDYTVRFIM